MPELDVTDLDAVLARLDTPGEVPCTVCAGTGAAPDLSDCPLCLGLCVMGTDTGEAMQQTIRSLVARVRTAEAERDEQAKQREHWATENNSLWSWILALGALAKKGGFQDGGLGWQTYISRAVHAAVEDRALRTVETAEGWEQWGIRRREDGAVNLCVDRAAAEKAIRRLPGATLVRVITSETVYDVSDDGDPAPIAEAAQRA